ncbi:MAG: zf-HC2 domain-containing protein [Christensenellales bacterium]|jgi:predicted anti-sigma-YlaC factor YlaD
MCECSEIQNMLVDYLNGGLDQGGNMNVVFHLSSCGGCREEAALLIRLKNANAQALEKIPDDIIKSAFNLIGDAEGRAQSPVAKMRSALGLVGSVLRLAASAII